MNPSRSKNAKALILGGCLAAAAASSQNIILTPEHAPDVSGPWTSMKPGANADGSMVVPAKETMEFFRLRIERTAEAGGSPISLVDVPTRARQMAADHLAAFSATDASGDQFGDPWSGGKLQLGPIVHPVFDPAAAPGSGPAYLEFKVVPVEPAPTQAGGFLRHGPFDTTADFGYILVSLTASDFPITEFTKRGKTQVEQLHRLAGSSNVKVFRFGGTLFVAEDAAGKLVANWGAQPWKPGPEIIAPANRSATASGDDDAHTDNRPNLPKFTMTPYTTYEEFKADYVTNAVYQYLRQRQANLAREQWNIEEGIRTPIVSVPLNDLVIVRPGDKIVRYSVDTENGDIARISIGTGGVGLRVAGISVGHGVLRVITSAGEYVYSLQVTPLKAGGFAGGSFKPGWQPPLTAKAGDYSQQPKYEQMISQDFCPAVGCGPNAWAICFAWFERNKGVKAAFGNWLTADAPAQYDRMVDVGTALDVVMPQLHELCDVICSPTGSGATAPGDMIDGGLEYTWGPSFSGYLKRFWDMHWTLLDACPEDGAWACRNAIKKGYPGVVGLGWLWHYAVAFQYAYQEFEVVQGGPVLLSRRFLLCNMGFGPDVPAKSFNFCDTFFASDMKLWKGPLAP